MSGRAEGEPIGHVTYRSIMLLVVHLSGRCFSLTVNRIALLGRTVVLLLLALLAASFLTSEIFAQDDIGLPVHPKAIPSTIVRRSGEGDGTRWVQVNFTVNAPYKQVVRFYQEKVGRHAQISEIDSGKLLNALILFSRDSADQFNINIRSELGKEVTTVELTRNSARP